MAIYVVQAGDSLWAISSTYGVPIERLVEVNGLESFALIPGLALYIPDNQLINRAYTIKPGDTLWEIANRYSTSVEAIVEMNPSLILNQLTVGNRIMIPSPYKNRLITLGFIFPQSSGIGFTMLEQHANQLSYVAIVAYSFTNQGFTYMESDDRAVVEKSKQVGVTPLLMLRNFQNGDFNAELAGNVLSNLTYRRNLVMSTVKLVKEKGYGGVSMDFEFIPPARRQDYVTLLSDLKADLKELVLHVNVHAKTEDNFTNRIVGGHDYRGIGEVADLVAVMTIDYGYPTGPPEPITPIWWMHQVIRYSLRNIPSQKLQAAIALYGYDKQIPSYSTKALSAQDAQNQAIRTGSDIMYNTIESAPRYKYWQNQHHITFFEDIRSIQAKYELIDLYQLAGVTFWQLGLQFPQNWVFVEKNILVRKS